MTTSLATSSTISSSRAAAVTAVRASWRNYSAAGSANGGLSGRCAGWGLRRQRRGGTARPRRATILTQSPRTPNELALDFTATRPNERWVTDITYVWTLQGWAHVAVILDLFVRPRRAPS